MSIIDSPYGYQPKIRPRTRPRRNSGYEPPANLDANSNESDEEFSQGLPNRRKKKLQPSSFSSDAIVRRMRGDRYSYLG